MLARRRQQDGLATGAPSTVVAWSRVLTSTRTGAAAGPPRTPAVGGDGRLAVGPVVDVVEDRPGQHGVRHGAQLVGTDPRRLRRRVRRRRGGRDGARAFGGGHRAFSPVAILEARARLVAVLDRSLLAPHALAARATTDPDAIAVQHVDGPTMTFASCTTRCCAGRPPTGASASAAATTWRPWCPTASRRTPPGSASGGCGRSRCRSTRRTRAGCCTTPSSSPTSTDVVIAAELFERLLEVADELPVAADASWWSTPAAARRADTVPGARPPTSSSTASSRPSDLARARVPRHRGDHLHVGHDRAVQGRHHSRGRHVQDVVVGARPTRSARRGPLLPRCRCSTSAGSRRSTASLVRGGRSCSARSSARPASGTTSARTDCVVATLVGPMTALLHAEPRRDDDADNPLRDVLLGPMIPEMEEFERRFGVAVGHVLRQTEIGARSRPAGTTGRGRPAAGPRRLPVAPRCDSSTSTTNRCRRARSASWSCARRSRGRSTPATTRCPSRPPRRGATAGSTPATRSAVDDDGWYYFVDRMKDAIRRRGENISRFEVENFVIEHPDVADCAAIGVPAELRRGRSHGRGRRHRPGDVRPGRAHRVARAAACRSSCCPRYVEVVDDLPRNETSAAGAQVRDPPARGRPGHDVGPRRSRRLTHRAACVDRLDASREDYANGACRGVRRRGTATSVEDREREPVNEKLYIHEYIDIIGQNRAKYMYHMTANFSPMAQEDRNQLCYGVWGVAREHRPVARGAQHLGARRLRRRPSTYFRHELDDPTLQDPRDGRWWAAAAPLRAAATIACWCPHRGRGRSQSCAPTG